MRDFLAPFWFLLPLVLVAHGQNVFVDVNDPSLVTVPASLWSDSSLYNQACGGMRWMNQTNQSVSLTFNGTGVSLDLLSDQVGRLAQIALDGRNVFQAVTYDKDAFVFSGVCNIVPWSSDPLSPGQHTVTVTALDTDPRVKTPPGWLDVRSFRYVGLAGPSATGASLSTGTSTAGRASALSTGALVGIALGGLAGVLLFAGTVFIWMRRRRAYHKKHQRLQEALLIPTSSFSSKTSSMALQTYDGVGTGSSLSPESALPKHYPQTSPVTSHERLPPADLRYHITNPDSASSASAPTTAEISSPKRLKASSPKSFLPSGPQGQHEVPSPSTSPQLSNHQLELLQRLSEQDVPSQVLGAVAESLVNSSMAVSSAESPEAGTTGASPRTDEDPPRYDPQV